jgi:hypothetical protein
MIDREITLNTIYGLHLIWFGNYKLKKKDCDFFPEKFFLILKEKGTVY